MAKLVTLSLLGLLLIPALPASAQSDRGLEGKLDLILRRLERLEQHAKQSDRGMDRRDDRRDDGQHDRRRGPDDRRRGPDDRRQDDRRGDGDRSFGPRGPQHGPAGKRQNGMSQNGKAPFGPHMIGRLPDVMRAAMQGDARAQAMLGKLHKKIGAVLKASKKSTGNRQNRKTQNVDVRRHKVMAVELDRRRVELELAQRDLKRRVMAQKKGKQKRYKAVLTDDAHKRAPKAAPKAASKSKRRVKKSAGSDIDRMRELTKKSRQLQEEIRRLRAELAEQK
jgi:hypothetical protein